MTGSLTSYERSDDPNDPCALCVSWVCAYCETYDCDDDCPGVVDQGAMKPMGPYGEVKRLYRDVHRGCQASVEAYLEECRRDPT